MTAPQVRKQGDETELYAVYAAQLRRIVAHQVRTSSANIDDACAFAWLQMLRYQPGRETLLGWLVKTGTREAVRLDRRARRDEVFADGVDETHGVVPSIEVRLEVLAAREAITSARLRQREADLLGAHVAGYSYVEIADANGITVRTVERQLLRAKRRLRHARKRQRLESEDAAAAAPRVTA
jgi:RNA polymerase sigma factor (sigma-70 family)